MGRATVDLILVEKDSTGQFVSKKVRTKGHMNITPYLVVHRSIDPAKKSEWSISHVPTGRLLKTGYAYMKDATDDVHKVKDACDWDFDEETMHSVDLKPSQRILYPAKVALKDLEADLEKLKPKLEKFSSNNPKLEELAEIEGFDSDMELLNEYAYESVMPGICVNEGCDYTTNVEPDQSAGWCEECRTGTVQSALILAGLI